MQTSEHITGDRPQPVNVDSVMTENNQQTDILYLDENHPPWRPADPLPVCRLLRTRSLLTPDDLYSYSDAGCRQRQHPDGRPGLRIRNDDRRFDCDESWKSFADRVILVSADTESDVRVEFTAFLPQRNDEVIRILPETLVSELCLLRLSLNVCSLRLARPMSEYVALRHAPRRCVPSQDVVTDTLWNGINGATMRIAAFRRRWILSTDPGVPGIHRLVTTLALKAPLLFNTNGDIRFNLGQLLWSADPEVHVMRLSASKGILLIHIVKYIPTDHYPLFRSDIKDRGLTDVSIILLFAHQPITGPRFSQNGYPYLATSHSGATIDVLAPTDITLMAGLPQAFSVPRRFEGNFVGIFVAAPLAPIRVTSAVWTRNSRLDLIVSSHNSGTLHRGTRLGTVYFVPASRAIPKTRSCCCFSDTVRSKLTIIPQGATSDGEQALSTLSLLGLHVDVRVDALEKMAVRLVDDNRVFLGLHPVSTVV